MMGIQFLRPTNTQTTRKTIRGMVSKNLIALMLTGHPLGLIENIIHTPIDWVVNKNFCTTNKLLNMGVHVATCMSIDSLIHGTGHEIAETLMANDGGNIHEFVSGDVVQHTDMSSDAVVDTADIAVDTEVDQSIGIESSTDAIVSQTQQSTIESSAIQSPSSDSPMRKILEQKAKSMSKMMEMIGDEDITPSELVQIHQTADAQGLIDHTGHHHSTGDSHAGHHHGDEHMHDTHADHTNHDHEHAGHGALPILGGAMIEEYGPTMYKITKQRTRYFWDTMFNLSPISDTTIVKKSDITLPHAVKS